MYKSLVIILLGGLFLFSCKSDATQTATESKTEEGQAPEDVTLPTLTQKVFTSNSPEADQYVTTFDSLYDLSLKFQREGNLAEVEVLRGTLDSLYALKEKIVSKVDAEKQNEFNGVIDKRYQSLPNF